MLTAGAAAPHTRPERTEAPSLAADFIPLSLSGSTSGSLRHQVAKPSVDAPVAIPMSMGINTLLTWGQEQSKTWKAPGSKVSKGAGS